MDAVEFYNEYARMCKSMDSDCEECNLYKAKGELSCYFFILRRAAEAVPIVEQWAKEHPQKTIMDDFFEKYPNAPKNDLGFPNDLCPSNIGLNDFERDKCKGGRFEEICKECWSQPIEDYK